MKRIALIAMFLVTWKTFTATAKPDQKPAECVVKTEAHQEEYFDWFKAAARATAIKAEPGNYDVKVWSIEEPVIKEGR